MEYEILYSKSNGILNKIKINSHIRRVVYSLWLQIFCPGAIFMNIKIFQNYINNKLLINLTFKLDL